MWTDKSVDFLPRKFYSGLCAREYETKRQGKIQRAPLASHLFSAMPPLEAAKALVSIMMSVGWSSNCEPWKLGHYDNSKTHFQGTAQRLTHVRLPTVVKTKMAV